MITIVRPRLQRRTARTSRRAWTTSSPSRSPARWPARSQARRRVQSLRELRLPLQLHQLHFRLVTTTALHLIQPLSHLHHKLFNHLQFSILADNGPRLPPGQRFYLPVAPLLRGGGQEPVDHPQAGGLCQEEGGAGQEEGGGEEDGEDVQQIWALLSETKHSR